MRICFSWWQFVLVTFLTALAAIVIFAVLAPSAFKWLDSL